MHDLSTRLIAWQHNHGRHGLPWQGTRDPYRIWLSEIMLQQTQVATVIPYYARFLERFPDAATLAAAPVEEVMALWSGLGYYARARNLHRAACAVMEEHGGHFPVTATVLAGLPGIGRSTAAAIAAFASSERTAILDGNVKRVLCRVFGIEGFPGERAVEERLWALAESLLPENAEDIGIYIQAQMDLGATVCTRTRPNCEACPLATQCVAHATKRVAELPTARSRKTPPRRTTRMAVVMLGNSVLLERRPPAGIWGGLLTLPEIPEGTDTDDWVLRSFGIDRASARALPP
ncbi:MAG: A/G-specific adenine glycosylase, partial [Azoarcus sp.]|nr:A/G-specific adenine glycosylase [Azoarcus sp.]